MLEIEIECNLKRKEEHTMQDRNEMSLYSAGDIAAILDISTNAARDFLEDASRQKLFPVIKVGVQYRVPATQFDEWNTYAKLHNVCEEGSGGCVMDAMIANPDGCSVYRPSDIQKILQFSRSKTYSFLREVYAAGRPFKVMKLGKSYRVNKVSFDLWFNSATVE